MDGVLFFAWGSGIVHKEKRKKGGGNLVIVVAVIGGFGLVWLEEFDSDWRRATPF